MNRAAIILSLLWVAGCASQHLVQIRGELHQKGVSDEFADGYVDGCSSGYHDAGNYHYDFSKDMPRYDSQPFYSEGWDEGYQKCKTKHESLEETFNTLTSD
jgi:hypothetical protein